MLHVTFSCIVPFPYSCSSFLFQDYQQIVNTTFLKAEIQKITIPLWTWSLRAPSFSIGSLDGLAFSQINVWPRDIWNLFRKFELATPISSYSSSLHLETTYYPLICSWIFFSVNTGRTLPSFPNEFSKNSGPFILFLRKNITSIFPNQNNPCHNTSTFHNPVSCFYSFRNLLPSQKYAVNLRGQC